MQQLYTKLRPETPYWQEPIPVEEVCEEFQKFLVLKVLAEDFNAELLSPSSVTEF